MLRVARVLSDVQNCNKKHLKMLGPFATASRRTPPVLHCHSPGVATVARRLRINDHNNIDNNDNNDNA